MQIFFAYTRNWNGEIASYERGEVPAHRLFGYSEMKRMGHTPSACPPPPRGLRRLLAKPFLWRIYQALVAIWRQREHDCIFAAMEASALPLLLFKRLGLLRTPVVVFCMAILHDRNRHGIRGWMWRRLLPAAEAIAYQTRMEQEAVWQEFGLRQDRQFLLPMYSDPKFFHPDESVPQGDYCLAAGTNQGRDYETLLKAFPRDQKLIVITDAFNAAIIEKHREPNMQVEVKQAVPIAKLKALYQGAKLVINPLKDIDQLSGHTVFLENLALGKVVIVSNVRGMFDYIRDGESSIAVKPHDVDDLAAKIRDVLAHPDDFAPIGRRASEWVAANFSPDSFGGNLLRIIEQVLHQKTQNVQPGEPAGQAKEPGRSSFPV